MESAIELRITIIKSVEYGLGYAKSADALTILLGK
jgi:hypothetical protein